MLKHAPIHSINIYIYINRAPVIGVSRCCMILCRMFAEPTQLDNRNTLFPIHFVKDFDWLTNKEHPFDAPLFFLLKHNTMKDNAVQQGCMQFQVFFLFVHSTVGRLKKFLKIWIMNRMYITWFIDFILISFCVSSYMLNIYDHTLY